MPASMTGPDHEQLPLSLNLVATHQPPTPSRAWLTAPHPTLPLVATAHADRTVRIYSLTTSHVDATDLSSSAAATSSTALLSTISGGHKRSVRSVAWKPNLKGAEHVLATGSFDASVGIWRNWELGNVARIQSGLGEDKTGLVGEDAPAGDGLAKGEDDEPNGVTAGQEKEEEDDEDWRFAIVLDGHESEVKSVAWSAGGNLLATCSRDKSVWIWEEVGPDDYETIAVLQEHNGDVKCVAWHPEEELLASASYDDEIRLWKEEVDDWGCVAVLRGHESTVWCVAWEPVEVGVAGAGSNTQESRHHEEGDNTTNNTEGNETETETETESQAWQKWLQRRKTAGPRLISCSEDRSIKVWRHVPTERVQQSRLSIIRSANSDEEWVEEATLPSVHHCGIYAVVWGSTSGLSRVVSTGGDGSVVVYEERWDAHARSTQWVVVARTDAAHGVFEVNHVTWARRRVKGPGNGGGERSQEIECIVTTGDDGSVKAWDLRP